MHLKPTEEQIAKQIELEREAISVGILRLKENTMSLEKRTYASATLYGVASIDALLPLLSEELGKTMNVAIFKGKNGPCFAEIAAHLNDIEPEALAAIALKITFDKVFSHKGADSQAAEVMACIGYGVEQECRMRYYEAEDSDLLGRIKRKYWHSSCGTANKSKLAGILMKRNGITWGNWKRELRVKLGGWLLDAIMRVSSWFDKDHRKSPKGTDLFIIPSAFFLEHQDRLMKEAEIFCPLAWPMLVPPQDWTATCQGGYLLNELMAGHSLVRGSDRTRRPGEMREPLRFLNTLQHVAYRLNPATVAVAEVLLEKRIMVGKFVPIVEFPLPPKPHDIADNKESRQQYRREAAETMNKNAQMFRRSCRTRKCMELIARFKEIERFYLPWSFDYRGRVYPIPAFLTPQDTDFGKSLLRFADESPMTPDAERWLAFQVATTYGLDKATMEDRLDWTASNHSLISRVALDALGNISDWEAAEEPWQFLAACEEYHACVITNTRNTTGLAVAIDATCSGLQILAGLARDGSTAALVNVSPAEKPQDAYKAVAEVAKTKLPKRLADLLDRKVTKRTVMTIPYNAKEYSNRQYIRAALKDKDAEFTFEDLKDITKAVVSSMNQIVPGPMSIMRWINDEVREALKRGATSLEWTTPSGFIVHQHLMKRELKRINLQLLGCCKITVSGDETKIIDKNRHKAATAPNLIHSLDASLLHLAFQDFTEPFSVIHDSVLCRATDMGLLNRIVRETYVKLFAENDYLRDFAQQINAVNDPPIIGDLSPDIVRESTYFFC
jgi:DNA-directed RNA polymerase